MPGKFSSYCTAFFALLFFLASSGCATGRGLTPVKLPPPSEWVKICTDWDDWDKAGPPFHIFGNAYYVGTCGITAILITGDDGHVLIDGGTEVGADKIAANIEVLGFSLRDIKLLLHSHEHFDHVGGLARLQQLSGARLLASPEAAPVLRTGIASDADPQGDMHDAFPAAQVDGIVQAGEVVKLGDLRLTPVATPGHTPGALSWQWRSCEGDNCGYVVYADSLSPISSDTYRFSDHPAYVSAYRAGLGRLAKLECDILLTPHPSASNLRSRLSTPQGLVNRNGCKAYAEGIFARLEQRMADERKVVEP